MQKSISNFEQNSDNILTMIKQLKYSLTDIQKFVKEMTNKMNNQKKENGLNLEECSYDYSDPSVSSFEKENDASVNEFSFEYSTNNNDNNIHKKIENEVVIDNNNHVENENNNNYKSLEENPIFSLKINMEEIHLKKSKVKPQLQVNNFKKMNKELFKQEYNQIQFKQENFQYQQIEQEHKNYERMNSKIDKKFKQSYNFDTGINIKKLLSTSIIKQKIKESFASKLNQNINLLQTPIFTKKNISNRSPRRITNAVTMSLPQTEEKQQFICTATEDLSIPTVVIRGSSDKLIQANHMFYNMISDDPKITLKDKFKDQVAKEDLKEYEDKLKEINESYLNDKMDKQINKLSRINIGFESKEILAELIFEPNQEKNNDLIQIYIKEEIEDDSDFPWYIVDPRNIFYLSWSMITLITLLYIIWQVTNELSFIIIQDNVDIMETTIDNIITIFQTIDILLNFFLAYEDEDGVWVSDLSCIIQNQVSGFWFYLDIISTIPFDLFIKSLTFNTQSIKVVRFLKIFKLIRLTKAYSFQNQNQIMKSELGEEIVGYIKRNMGQLELFKSMIQLLIITHFFTCLHFQVKSTIIEDDSVGWVENYYQQNLVDKTSHEIYFKLLSEHLKTALGLAVSNPPDSNLEITLVIIWMIMGLSMFGQGIGNISSYINYSNKRENEHSECVNFFREISAEMELDDQKFIIKLETEIDNQYRNWNLNQFDNMAKVLTNDTKRQLEYKLQDSFIEKLPIFSSLSFDVVKILKQCKLSTKNMIQNVDTVIDSVFIVTKGCVKTSNINNFKISCQFQPGDIISFKYFLKYFQDKFNIDFDIVFTRATEISLINKIKYNTMSKVLEHLIVKGKTLSLVSVKEQKQSEQAIGYDAEQIEVKYNILEEILRKDQDSFKKIFLHWKERNELITDEDRKEFELKLNQFNENPSMGIMIREEGKDNAREICITNKEFNTHFGLDENAMIESNIANLLQFDKILTWEDDGICDKQNEIVQMTYATRKIEILSVEKVKVIKEEDIEQNKLRRSRISLYMIFFEINNDILVTKSNKVSRNLRFKSRNKL